MAKKMTQDEIDNRYPLWGCEERPFHEYEETIYGDGAKIYTCWKVNGSKHKEYLFIADITNAKQIIRNLNQASRKWKPKFNHIGALIN